MSIDGRGKPKRRANYELEELDGELLIYHVSEEHVFHANATAALVWNLCSGEQSIDDIVQLLQSAFPDSSELPNDVRDTIVQLVELGAIELC